MKEDGPRENDRVLVARSGVVAPPHGLRVPGVGVANIPHHPLGKGQPDLHPKLRLVHCQLDILGDVEHRVRLYSGDDVESGQGVYAHRGACYGCHGDREGREG